MHQPECRRPLRPRRRRAYGVASLPDRANGVDSTSSAPFILAGAGIRGSRFANRGGWVVEMSGRSAGRAHHLEKSASDFDDSESFDAPQEWFRCLCLLFLSRLGVLLGVYATTHRSDCYNDAGWAHERRDKNRSLPPSSNAGPLASLKVSSQATRWDTLSAGKTHKSSSTPSHNLPAARSSFVGREREMQEAKRELTMTRLLTLTGVGGSGKTRLALEVARGL